MALYLRISAPFAAFRPLAAGWFRPSAKMITPSAAYGLILNFAAIDSRVAEHDPEHDGASPTSYTKLNLPSARIAVGIPDSGEDPPAAMPAEQVVLQQMHNYPVGRDAGVPREWTKGNKNNITPVRREFLSDLDFVIGVEAEERLYSRICDGLAGKWNDQRYGLPFLGDNSFLVDRVTVEEQAPECFWYEQIEGTKGQQTRINDATRLTIEVDRKGFSGTKSALFLPSRRPLRSPPPNAWTDVGSQVSTAN